MSKVAQDMLTNCYLLGFETIPSEKGSLDPQRGYTCLNLAYYYDSLETRDYMVREVIRIIQAKGLVYYRTGSGTSVIIVSSSDKIVFQFNFIEIN